MTLIELGRPVASPPRLATLPVAIIGAGPVGLAAAAHLVQRGIDFELFESGETAASSLTSWGHIRLFSPWRFLIDPAARILLEADAWVFPPHDALPLAAELVERYLAPLAALDAIASRTHLGTSVTTVTREGMDRTRTADRADAPFVLRLRSADGKEHEVLARAVIDASGTYLSANPLGSGGVDPLGASAVSDLVLPALPDVLGADRARFRGRHTVVVGAGHSAANTLLNLAELARQEPGTSVSWLIRNRGAVRVSDSADDVLAARAALGAGVGELVKSGAVDVIDGFEIARLSRIERGGDDAAVAPRVGVGAGADAGAGAGVRAGAGVDAGSDSDTRAGVRIIGRRGDDQAATVDADLIVNATGFRPDLSMLGEMRLDLDPVVQAPTRLAPLIDPNDHSCGTVEPHGYAQLAHPEPGFFIAGMKSYGRAPTFLLATGYEQVRSIVAWLDGDMRAATSVELVLPATGVCSSGAGDSADTTGSSCC